VAARRKILGRFVIIGVVELSGHRLNQELYLAVLEHVDHRDPVLAGRGVQAGAVMFGRRSQLKQEGSILSECFDSRLQGVCDESGEASIGRCKIRIPHLTPPIYR
jgi:hypothetical protein